VLSYLHPNPCEISPDGQAECGLTE